MYGKVRLKVTGERGTHVLDIPSNPYGNGVLTAVERLKDIVCSQGFGTMVETSCTLEIDGKEIEQWKFIVK